jgi:hypothetical protein
MILPLNLTEAASMARSWDWDGAGTLGPHRAIFHAEVVPIGTTSAWHTVENHYCRDGVIPVAGVSISHGV